MPLRSAFARLAGADVLTIRIDWRRGASPACVGAGLLACAAVAAFSAQGRSEPVPDALRLSLPGRTPPQVKLSEDRQDLTVEFGHAVSEAEAKHLADGLRGLLDGYNTGRTAVRYRLTRPVSASVDRSGGPIVQLVLQPDAAPPPDPAEERRLRMLAAMQKGRNGHREEAQAELQAAAAAAPTDIDLLGALADLNVRGGNWREGIGYYDKALIAVPGADDIRSQRDAVGYRYGASVHVSASAVFAPGERDQSTTVSVETPLLEGWRGFATSVTQRADAHNIRPAGQGSIGHYIAIKEQGSLGLAREWSSSAVTRLNLFAAQSTVGFGLEQSLQTGLGTTLVAASYHAPYWETLASFASNARRDTVGVSQSVPLPQGWTVGAGVSGIRYGLPSTDNVSSGVGVTGNVTKSLPASIMPLAGWRAEVAYQLNAEYLSAVRSGYSGPANEFVRLLDLRSREEHSLLTTFVGAVGTGIATAVAGYSVDRFGGSGPVALLRYASASETESPLSFAAEIATAPSLDLKTRQIYRIGASMTWRLGR